MRRPARRTRTRGRRSSLQRPTAVTDRRGLMTTDGSNATDVLPRCVLRRSARPLRARPRRARPPISGLYSTSPSPSYGTQLVSHEAGGRGACRGRHRRRGVWRLAVVPQSGHHSRRVEGRRGRPVPAGTEQGRADSGQRSQTARRLPRHRLPRRSRSAEPTYSAPQRQYSPRYSEPNQAQKPRVDVTRAPMSVAPVPKPVPGSDSNTPGDAPEARSLAAAAASVSADTIWREPNADRPRSGPVPAAIDPRRGRGGRRRVSGDDAIRRARRERDAPNPPHTQAFRAHRSR